MNLDIIVLSTFTTSETRNVLAHSEIILIRHNSLKLILFLLDQKLSTNDFKKMSQYDPISSSLYEDTNSNSIISRAYVQKIFTNSNLNTESNR